MTDKEFKRLSRPQLIDIIYQLQLQIDKLNKQNQTLEQELAELAGCAKLTRAQQDLMQSLKQRIALLSETLTKAR